MPGPTDVAAALSSPYYGMVFLGLAAQAYTDENDAVSLPQAVYIALTAYNPATGANFTPPLPAPGAAGVPDGSVATLPGNWCLDWGPAVSQDNSNLIYIASYRAPAVNNHGTPYFYCVAIRGTDTSAGFAGVLTQLAQDLEAFTTVSLPDVFASAANPNRRDPNSAPGTIAHGSASGFSLIAGLTARRNHGGPPISTGDLETVAQALSKLLADHPAGSVPVVVTGHSLGACITQIMATYLGWQFGPAQPMIAQAFAPPTPGFADFNATYQAMCPTSFFWHCSDDVVPYAYVTLTVQAQTVRGLEWAKSNLWGAYQWPAGAQDQNGKNIGGTACPSLPEAMVLMIDALDPLITQNYVRPSFGLMPLAGAIPMPQTTIQALLDSMGEKNATTTSGLSQLMWQHFPPNYAALMWTQYAGQLAFYKWSSYTG